MKVELEQFIIGGSLGGNQDWFADPMMKLGGCAAVCACDSSIYFALFKGVGNIYPFDKNDLSRKDYLAFSKIMKPYLRPRLSGVNKPELYIDGFSAYLDDRKVSGVTMSPLPGNVPFEEAFSAVCDRIDKGLPVPCLILNHRRREYADYIWHWFMITGYDSHTQRVKTVTYAEEKWISFEGLWDTGFKEKGGLILYRVVV